MHSMLVGSGCIYPSVVESFAWFLYKTNKQKFKVRQPQRAAKSKRPNAPSDGSKNNGIHTTKQEEYPSRHLQPVVIVIVCHAIATDGGVGGVLDHGLCVDRSVALTLRD